MWDEAQNLKDRASAAEAAARSEAKKAHAAANRDRLVAETARACEENERKARKKAEIVACDAKYAARIDRERSGHLSALGVVALICAALFLAYEKIHIFPEVGQWFAARGRGIGGFFGMTWVWQRGGASWFTAATTAPGIVGDILFFLVYIALNVGAAIVFLSILQWVWGRLLDDIERDHKMHWCWFSMVLCFYCCLYLYDWIKSLVPLNIFSVWLIAALTTAAAFYGKDVFARAKQGY